VQVAQLRYNFSDEPEFLEPDWIDEADLADVLRESLDDSYADADPEEMDEALANVLESMSPAEAFNFTKALSQIQRGAGQVVSDPAFGQIAGNVLPVAGGALGTVIGGPAGTSIGSSLGTAAAKAIPGRGPRTVPTTPGPRAAMSTFPAVGTPPVAGGSAAAAQGIVLTQQPEVLKALLALAMGQHGQKTVSGVPVASIMNMLSSVFGQAATDADELMYLDQEAAEGLHDGDTSILEAESHDDRSIYTTLVDADNAELAEAVGA
jgi:hypothetical protein